MNGARPVVLGLPWRCFFVLFCLGRISGSLTTYSRMAKQFYFMAKYLKKTPFSLLVHGMHDYKGTNHLLATGTKWFSNHSSPWQCCCLKPQGLLNRLVPLSWCLTINYPSQCGKVLFIRVTVNSHTWLELGGTQI